MCKQWNPILKAGLVLVVLFSGVSAAEESAPWTAQEVRLIDRPGEIVAVLKDGMTAIVKENHTAPVAAVRLYVKAGSIYEQDHLGAGMSHLFEHLLAAGATKNRTEEQSRELIQQIGARYNAYTTKSYTCYFLTVPVQHVGTALSLIADWVTRPTFPQDSFNREWGVVQRELEMGATDPYRQLWYQFDALRYRVNPAHYPVIGYQEIVQQLTRKEILDYYQKMYVPDRCVMVIVGDINAAEMLEAIKKECSDFTRRPCPDIVLPEEPPVTSPREVVKVMASMRGPAKMIIAFPSFKLLDPDLYALDTLACILGQGKSSRLYQSLLERQQLVLDIDAYNNTPEYAAGAFMIQCDVSPENIDKTTRAVWDELNRIISDGVSADELARAKRKLMVEHIRSHQTAEQQATSMGQDMLTTGDPHFSDRYVENIQKVTLEQMQQMAKKYFVAEKQLKLIITPRPLQAAQEEKTQKTNGSEIKKITLDNGLRVLLKRNPAVPLVNMQFYSEGGLIDEDDADNGITDMMAQLALKGTRDYTAKQIVDYFDGVGGSISGGCNNNEISFVSEVTSDDFEKAMAIFSEVITSPTFPEDELTKLKEQQLASIDQINNTWHLNAVRFFRKHFFTASPYQRIWMGQKKAVTAMTRDQIEQFHHKAVVGARSVLAVFGDIDPAAAEAMIRKQFASLPQGEPLKLDSYPGDSPVKVRREFVEKTDKNGATVFIGFPGLTVTDIQDRYPMEVMTEIIGSNQGWLHEELRGNQLVYYAWGFWMPSLLPGYVGATAQCEAEKVPLVLDKIQKLLHKAASGDFSEKEVATGKSNRINAEILDKQTNADAAHAAAIDELYGFGYDWSKGYADRIMAVTVDDVKRVAEKYLSSPPTVTIVTSKPELVKPKPTAVAK